MVYKQNSMTIIYWFQFKSTSYCYVCSLFIRIKFSLWFILPLFNVQQKWWVVSFWPQTKQLHEGQIFCNVQQSDIDWNGNIRYMYTVRFHAISIHINGIFVNIFVYCILLHLLSLQCRLIIMSTVLCFCPFRLEQDREHPDGGRAEKFTFKYVLSPHCADLWAAESVHPQQNHWWEQQESTGLCGKVVFMVKTLPMNMKDSFPVAQRCILSLVPSFRLPSVRIASSSNNPAERIIFWWDEGWRSVWKRTAGWRSQPWTFWAAWRWTPRRGRAAGRIDFTAPCSGFGPLFSIFKPVGRSESDLHFIVSQLKKRSLTGRLTCY